MAFLSQAVCGAVWVGAGVATGVAVGGVTFTAVTAAVGCGCVVGQSLSRQPPVEICGDGVAMGVAIGVV